MRETPFSVSLEQANSTKELSMLAQEMSDLVMKALKTDKRTLRCDKEKAIFKAKLERYCTLYRQVRDKFLVIQKRDGKSSTYKEPQSFERLVRDFNWQKTVTYSKPIKRNDDEEDHLGALIPDYDNDIPIKNEIDMAVLFKRTDPEVIEAAKTLSEKEFVEAYSHTTASETTLKDAYSKIRATVQDSSIKERVGEEASDQELGTTGAAVYKEQDKVKFEFAGSNLEGTIILIEDDKYTIQSGDGTKYPVKIDKIRGHITANKKSAAPKEKPTIKTEATPKVLPPTDPDGKLSFKSLDKDTKLQIIQKLFDEGNTTTAMVKTKLLESYTIGHYDDVYNVFIKIKK